MLPLTLAGKASRRGGERRASGQGCVAPLPEVPRLKHERSVGIWTCVLFLITSCESRKRRKRTLWARWPLSSAPALGRMATRCFDARGLPSTTTHPVAQTAHQVHPRESMAEREGYRGYRPRTDALATKAKIVIDEAVGNRNHATLLAHGVHVLMFHACPSCLVYPRRGRLARQRRG
jgi:hypothetical protein